MNEQPLGHATIQVTYVQRDGNPHWFPTALLTVRAKDQDLSAEQLEAVSASCLKVAAAIRADEQRDEKGAS